MGTVTGAALCAAIMASSAFFSHSSASRGCHHSAQIVESAEKHNIDPLLLAALVRVESNWKKDVVSYAGACGLTQVIHRYSKFTCQQLKNPKIGLDEGAKKLHFWIHKYGKDNVTVGLCGYNAGFHCKGKNPNKAGLAYAKKVLMVRDKLKRKL